MGSIVVKVAKQLGLNKLRLTTLYARPRRIHQTFGGISTPDIIVSIRDYIHFQDSSFLQGRSGGGRNRTYYFLSQAKQIYMEVIDKASGFFIVDPSNHAFQVNIYCNEEQYIKEIAQILNNLFNNGILVHMDWKKIEGKYKVKADDCIAEWNKWL